MTSTVSEVVKSFQGSVNQLLDEIYKVNELHKKDTEKDKVYHTRKVITNWFRHYGIYK